MPKRAETLRGTRNIAKEDFTRHKHLAKFAITRGIDISPAGLEKIDMQLDNPKDRWRDWNVEQALDVKKNLEVGASHYKQHAAEYHDLALMDAHLDGVKIAVEQPLELGEKVEVHMRAHNYEDVT